MRMNIIIPIDEYHSKIYSLQGIMKITYQCSNNEIAFERNAKTSKSVSY